MRSRVEGSRPCSLQACSTRANCSAAASAQAFVYASQPFQTSAYWATIRCIRGRGFSVPIRIGGPEGRGPRGMSPTSRALW